MDWCHFVNLFIERPSYMCECRCLLHGSATQSGQHHSWT